ncbi:MAG: cobalt-zinc-cadmium efflux system outer membrane protein [Planctomycetota bacterium]|jgi:cobalt-zinc-cadmium efflux system outer membrane protein
MSARTLFLLLLSGLASCVSYERNDATPESIAAIVAARVGGTFTVDQAIDVALRQNPRLQALTARLRAADAATTVPLPVRANWLGRNKSIEAVIDPIELLGWGPRGAAIDRAEARVLEAAAQLVVQRWQIIAGVATEFRIHETLQQLQVADLELDVASFERAGLASPVAAMQLRAALARSNSERVELARERSDNLARLRELLGLPDAAELIITAIDANWLQQPEGTASDIITRPDLSLAAARFEVADAEFYQAVTEQYPSLQLGPNVSLTGNPLRAMAMLQVPIGMQGLAEAAREHREATRAELESAFLQATREASVSQQQFVATQAVAMATAAGLQSSTTAFHAARASIEVEVDAFAKFANAATTVMRNTMEHRRAVLEHVRAEVQRATAYGWPRRQQPSPAKMPEQQS